MNWGFIRCHTKNRKGALSKEQSIYEYDYYGELLEMLSYPSADRNNGGVTKACEELKILDVTATIEPHFNAFNGKTEGAEILVLKDDYTSFYCAWLIMEKFKKMFPERRIRARDGIKFVSKGDRGYNNLKDSIDSGMKVAVLPELFFGDNPKDYMRIKDQYKFWKACLDEKR